MWATRCGGFEPRVGPLNRPRLSTEYNTIERHDMTRGMRISSRTPAITETASGEPRRTVGQAVALLQDDRAVLDREGRPGEAESAAMRQVLVQGGPERSADDGDGRAVIGACDEGR
jgi:hypothetical protein